MLESSRELQDRFNRGKYIERATRGEFLCCLKDAGPIKTDGPLAGMRSYLVGYIDTTTLVHTFTAHCYLDQAGNLGASGLWDPKWLFEDGIAYTCNRRRGVGGTTF